MYCTIRVKTSFSNKDANRGSGNTTENNISNHKQAQTLSVSIAFLTADPDVSRRKRRLKGRDLSIMVQKEESQQAQRLKECLYHQVAKGDIFEKGQVRTPRSTSKLLSLLELRSHNFESGSLFFLPSQRRSISFGPYISKH